MQTIISLGTEKLARRGFQHEGPHHTYTLKKHWGGSVPPSPGPDAYELFKTPHRLVRSTVKLCGWKKRNLGGSWDMCEPKSVCVWGGGRDLLPPPPWKVWGGKHSPCPPPFLYAYELLQTPWKGIFMIVKHQFMVMKSKKCSSFTRLYNCIDIHTCVCLW